MSEALLIPSGEGEIVADSSDRRVEILSDDERLHATWSRFGSHHEGADLHVHRHHTDLFYVLAGELTVMLGRGGQETTVPVGTLVRVPPLVVHGFKNGSDAEVRYLNFHAPGEGFADFLRALRDGRPRTYDQHSPPPDGGRPATDAVVGGEGFPADWAGLRVVLLADVEEIALAEVSSDRGVAAPEPHVHRRHVESFYVLEGEITLAAGNRELHAQPGAWVQVPPGVPHTFTLPDNGPVRFLNAHTPSCGFGTFLRGLDEAPSDDEPAAVRATFDQVPAPLWPSASAQ